MNWWRPTGARTENALARMRTDLDRVFDRFIRDPFENGWPGEREGWAPALDVKETDGEVVVKAEIPGVAPKDLHVALNGNLLTISGHKEECKEERGEGCCLMERSFGSFRRTIPMPDGIDAEKVSAEQDNGVLTIRVAKLKGAKPKQITVRPAMRTA